MSTDSRTATPAEQVAQPFLAEFPIAEGRPSRELETGNPKDSKFRAQGFEVVLMDTQDEVAVMAYEFRTWAPSRRLAARRPGPRRWKSRLVVATFPTPDGLESARAMATAYARALAGGVL